MNKKQSDSSSWSKAIGKLISRYFMGGVLISAPIFVTIYIVHWVVVKMDGWIKPYVDFPGLGFVLILASMVVIGWIGSLFLINRVFKVIDHWMENIPGFSFIYSSVRDFIKAFVGDQPRFKQTVRVQIFQDEVWLLGFITDEELNKFDLGEEFVAVYVPQTYNVAGQLYLLKRERVCLIEGISPADAMRYAVTAGTVEIATAKKQQEDTSRTEQNQFS